MVSTVTAYPCVDVIIPVFNGEGTILSAINSVLVGQSDWVGRIIVIDDGSVDNTAALIEGLGSPLIDLVSTQNEGVSRARNFGIERSRSEWIAFLDADDIWMPGKLEMQLYSAREHDAGFICGAVSNQLFMADCQISPELLTRGNFVATSSVLVKRNILQKIQPVFSPEMTFAEDYLTWLKCLSLTGGYYISNKLVSYAISERPRYRWVQILKSIFVLNIKYSRFLSRLQISLTRRNWLRWSLVCGSAKSIISIIKRFLKSYK